MAASSSAASNSMMGEQNVVLKRNSDDIGWVYGELVNPNDRGTLKCKLCNHVCKGGVYRMKQHIAGIKGNVKSCTKATEEDKKKCNEALDSAKQKKKKKSEIEEEVKEEVSFSAQRLEESEELTEIGSKRPRELGPMDRYTSMIDPESSISERKRMRQQIINDGLWKKRREDAHAYLARWVYEAGIPFHSIAHQSFDQFVEAVGQFGPGYKPPSQYQLREPLLKQEVEKTTTSLQKHKEEWKKGGCSIMTDAWTDRKRRSIMNLCVHCKKGVSFLKSIEDSDEAHTGSYIFKWVEKAIEEVGPENVVQVVTDNASNNMAAADLMKKKRPNLFWTSCAIHTLNLVLEGIGKTPKFKSIIGKAKALTIFIYAHHKTLSLMRKFTQKRDIVRPGVTRFASSFLTLQSLMEKKEKLRLMFSSDEWGKCKWCKTAKGKAAAATVLSLAFCNCVNLCLRVFAPLVKVLRLVVVDRKPSMGFLVGGLVDAKKEIMEAYKNNENNYKLILEIIDAKTKGRLDSPLHLAGYFLNPYYYFRDDEVEKNGDVMDAIFTCIDSFYPDFEIQNIVSNIELLKYKNASGMFGRKVAIMGRMKNDDLFDPVGWWSNYGGDTPNLQRMAKKILSLTSSSSGCERNWSTFEGVHTKKRNGLDASRLNSLVYVQFNAKLINKKKGEEEGGVDVLLAKEASRAQEWIVEIEDEEEAHPDSGLSWKAIGEAAGADEVLCYRRSKRRGDTDSSTSNAAGELDEDLDETKDEEEDEEEITFEDSDDDDDDDDDRVLNEFGGEEEDE